MMKNKATKLAIIPAAAALTGAAFMTVPAQAGETTDHAKNAWTSSNLSYASDYDHKNFTNITDLLGVDNVDVLSGGIVNAPLVDTGDVLNGNGSNNATPIASGNGDILSGNDTPVASGNDVAAPVASGNDTDIPVEAPVASGNDVSAEAPVASGNDTAVDVPVEAPVASGNDAAVDVPVTADGNASGNNTDAGLGDITTEVTDVVDRTLSDLDSTLGLGSLLR